MIQQAGVFGDPEICVDEWEYLELNCVWVDRVYCIPGLGCALTFLEPQYVMHFGSGSVC